MDPISMAAIAAGVLPRALPYLMKLGSAMGDSLAKEAGEKFGPEAWETAKGIWSRLGGKLLEKPAAKDAVNDVVKNPEDQDNVASLRKEIRKVLEEDSALKTDLEKVVGNRIKVDMTLKNVIKSVVTGADLDALAGDLDVTMKMEDVTEGTVTGVRIKKLP